MTELDPVVPDLTPALREQLPRVNWQALEAFLTGLAKRRQSRAPPEPEPAVEPLVPAVPTGA